jgi:hypothetical protein
MSPASPRETSEAGAAPAVGLPEWRALSCLMGAMALGFGYLAWAQGSAIEGLRRALDEGLAMRPPIAVIDYAAVGAAVAAGQAPEAIEPLFTALKTRSAALGAEGVLVINRAAVDAVPPQIVFGAAVAPETATAAIPAGSPAAPIQTPVAVPTAPPGLIPPAAAAPARPQPAQGGLSAAEARALMGAIAGAATPTGAGR